MCYYGGKVYSLEGMTDGISASLLQIVDVEKHALEAIIDLDDMGITEEPEMVAVRVKEIYITDISGHLYLISCQ